jgi:Domain of unknown function (DUF4214)
MNLFEIEPNDSQSTAIQLQQGVPVAGQVSSTSDRDFYKIAVTGAGVVQFSIVLPSSNFSSYQISLYDSGGTLQRSYSTAVSASYSLATSGAGVVYANISSLTGRDDYQITATSSVTSTTTGILNISGINEIISGSEKIDTVIFSSPSPSYKISYSYEIIIVQNIGSGEEDRLTNVERIKFADKSMAFDITGNAGKAYRVYKAAFARDPQSGDMSGLGFWISRIDNGMDMVEVAARFIDSPEFRGLYGQNPSNADFLTKVYTNVLGRAPDQGGYSWWLNELNTNPTKTKAKVLADFAESGENQAGVASLIGNGIQYTEFVG